RPGPLPRRRRHRLRLRRERFRAPAGREGPQCPRAGAGAPVRGRRLPEDHLAREPLPLAPVAPLLGILEISPFRDVWVLHGAGVGGGSLGYANVLTAPA